MIKGLEYWSIGGKAERARTVQPGEEKTQGRGVFSTPVEHRMRRSTMELESFQWCPARGQPATGTNWTFERKEKLPHS